MMENLKSLPGEWELIVVNDGSTDRSLEIVQSLEKVYSNLYITGYPINRGRGFALRTGLAKARGDLVITTEIDSSWGNEIAHQIVAEFEQKKDADIIVASPHLPEGGYKNVPFKRVFLSSMGNRLIRAGTSSQITMNTGMTRGYKRKKFLDLPLDEDGKEIHLEIIQKAISLGYRIYEIPAILEWKDKKLASKEGVERKSSSKLNKLIRTHLIFTFLAAPFRYMYIFSGALTFVGAIFFFGALYNLTNPEPSIFLAITSFFLFLFAFLISSLGTLSHQNLETQGELWRIRSLLNKLKSKKEKED
mgnify:FL=1